jgi:mRNA interferase HigB
MNDGEGGDRHVIHSPRRWRRVRTVSGDGRILVGRIGIGALCEQGGGGTGHCRGKRDGAGPKAQSSVTHAATFLLTGGDFFFFSMKRDAAAMGRQADLRRRHTVQFPVMGNSAGFPLWETLCRFMRIIAWKTLAEFGAAHPKTKASLTHWRSVAKAAQWQDPNEVRVSFSKAKVLNGERVLFEVAGGNYRTVVAFDFERQIAFIKFIGSHAEYDKIDPLTINLF